MSDPFCLRVQKHITRYWFCARINWWSSSFNTLFFCLITQWTWGHVVVYTEGYTQESLITKYYTIIHIHFCSTVTLSAHIVSNIVSEVQTVLIWSTSYSSSRQSLSSLVGFFWQSSGCGWWRLNPSQRFQYLFPTLALCSLLNASSSMISWDTSPQ